MLQQHCEFRNMYASDHSQPLQHQLSVAIDE